MNNTEFHTEVATKGKNDRRQRRELQRSGKVKSEKATSLTVAVIAFILAVFLGGVITLLAYKVIELFF